MKTLFKQPFPMLVATIVTTATLAACSNEMNPADVSAVEPQAVTVRFTTPSAGQSAAEDLWQENDQVTVTPQAQGDPSITFGYTKQEDGTYVWQNILEGGNSYFVAALPASFTAYYPTTEGTSIDAFTLPTISDDGQIGQADQNDPKKLRAADYMTAPSTTVPYGENTLNLTLAHRLCRLTFVVTEYGNEFNGVVPTLEDVKIKSQNRTVNLTYEGDQVKVGDTTGNPVWVSPLPSTNASDQPTYTAIVTPCTLTSGTTELMSLTVNGISLPVKYKGDLTKLASGSAYTFHLKVGKDYVTVTGSDVTGWTGTETPVTSKEVKYFTAADLKVGDYYYSDGTWSDGGLRKLYTDGTFVMDNVAPKSSNTVIGIVYWVGDATARDQTLEKDHPECTHGLVVALSGDVESAWQSSYTSVHGWLNSNRPNEFLSVQSGFEADDPLNNIQGYNNTKAIEAFNAANSDNIVTAVQKAVDYRKTVPAPDKSSDWYLPSAKELTLLCGRDVDSIWYNVSGTANRDLINGKLKLIDGATQLSLSHYYWSSSESNPRTYAFSVLFDRGNVSQDDKYYRYRVRFSLAF